MAIQQVIKGAVKVQGVPESACFDTFAQLLNALGTYLTIEIPNQAFSNVVISNQQPGQADRNKIWWRIANSGGFVGIYFFVNGEWIQVLPAPNQIFWLTGDSANPPTGFKFLELSDGILTGTNYTELLDLAIPFGGVPPFVYYPAIYVGV
jgi:hypothetical protein